jgi:hypothetical protein
MRSIESQDYPNLHNAIESQGSEDSIDLITEFKSRSSKILKSIAMSRFEVFCDVHPTGNWKLYLSIEYHLVSSIANASFTEIPP